MPYHRTYFQGQVMELSPIAVFRFYASHWRGAGHAMRCMTLARSLKKRGWVCRFATEEESYQFIPTLKEFDRLDPDELYEAPIFHDLLVVDHYDLGYKYENYFRPFVRVIVAIDDLADREHDCDIILDQAYGRTSNHYRNNVPPASTILTGPSYALLREEFYMRREEALSRRQSVTEIKRIFVNFGGNDQKNMILETLRKLSSIGYEGAIDIVFGVMAEHRQSVELFAKTMPNEILFHTNPDMADLMIKADLAVGAPASTAWERFCLGLPSLLLKTADNQEFTYRTLLKEGLALGDGIESLSQKGLIVDFDPEFYRACVNLCAKQTKGCGTEIVVDIIEEKLEKKNDIRKKIS